MKIKIISGTYGSRPDGGNRVVPVNMGEVCDVPAEEAARLCSIGVAQYVSDEVVATADNAVDGGSAGANLPGEENPPRFTTDGVAIPDALEIVDGHFGADSLRQMTNQNLAKLGTDLGLDVSKCKVKEDYVAALMTVELDFTVPENDADNEVDDGSAPPKFNDNTVVV